MKLCVEIRNRLEIVSYMMVQTPVHSSRRSRNHQPKEIRREFWIKIQIHKYLPGKKCVHLHRLFFSERYVSLISL